eukprot:Hpha_TRINITY_DN27624_c0_g1::TRINITY_DN27624_c0_g1_i1::g.57318::m.57318
MRAATGRGCCSEVRDSIRLNTLPPHSAEETQATTPLGGAGEGGDGCVEHDCVDRERPRARVADDVPGHASCARRSKRYGVEPSEATYRPRRTGAEEVRPVARDNRRVRSRTLISGARHSSRRANTSRSTL